MDFQIIFFIVFALIVARMLFGVVKNRGFRGMMFGAPLGATVGEIPLGSRGLVNTCFDRPSNTLIEEPLPNKRLKLAAPRARQLR